MIFLTSADFQIQHDCQISLSRQTSSGKSKMVAFRSGSSSFLSLLNLLCFLTVRVSSCGMSTHIDIAHQAINWFKDARNGTDYREIILKHQDAFIAGNPYPDSMYSSICYSGKFHSISEDTHWAPFLNATVNYIRKKYPKPWDQVGRHREKHSHLHNSAHITYKTLCHRSIWSDDTVSLKKL